MYFFTVYVYVCFLYIGMVRAPFPHPGQGVAAENSDSDGQDFCNQHNLETRRWMNIAEHELPAGEQT